MIHMKCPDLFSLKNKKKLIKKLSSAAVVIGVLRVKQATISRIKALTALVGQLSLSLGWENGSEYGLTIVSFNP